MVERPPNDNHRRRGPDKNWGRFVTGIPVALSLTTLLASGIAAWTTLDLTQDSHATQIETIGNVQDEFRPRIRALETEQRGIKEQLDGLQIEQQRASQRASEDRREILDAITELGRKIDRP